MPRVQGEEQDYADNPDDGFPQIIPENVDTSASVNHNTSTRSSFIFSYFQQQQQQQQQQQPPPTDKEQAVSTSTDYSAHVGFNNNVAQIAPNNSTSSHYNRLKHSSNHVNVNALNHPSSRNSTANSTLGSSSPAVAPMGDMLNDTMHFIKGKGVLASDRDLALSPIAFAEGCKLLHAAALGNASAIHGYLKRNPENIFFRDYDRRTALHVAASEGKLHIVKLLVEKYNSPINRSDRWGGSPLDDAHAHRHELVATYLRKKGGSTGSTDQTTNLITAAVTGDLDELKMLLNNNNNNNNHHDQNHQNPSSSVRDTKNEKRVNIDASDYDARTALHIACALGHTNIVHFLVAKGANVNVVDNWGGTPLDDAIRTSNLPCIKVLKENGGRVGINKKKHLTEASERTKMNEDQNLNIDFGELDVIDKIGSGAFGEIFKCRWRGTLVAAKCIKSSKIVDLWKMNDMQRSTRNVHRNPTVNDLSAEDIEEALKDFRLETSILRTLRHPNICMLLGYSQTEDFEVMISELMNCSLLDVFTSHILHGTKMSHKTQIIYAQQLAKGMNYLHQCKPPIIHRDLKPANLLVDFSGTLKITDFGLAKVRPDPTAKETEKFRMTGETGSYRFMAPEVFRHEEYSETVDVYSFAMILFYLTSGRAPWSSLSGLNAVIKAAVEGDRPILHRSWDNQISSLMQRCWDENPNGRPPFSSIVMELNDYSKNVLKLDLDDAINYGEDSRKCCVIS